MKYYLHKYKFLRTILKYIEGSKMVIMVKNAQSLLERFEESIEKWAQKFF